jgi:cell division protein FtsW
MGQAKRRSPNSAPSLRIDAWLLGAALATAGLGLLMVSSASIAIAEKQGMGLFHYAIKHAVALGIGGLLALAALKIPLTNLERASPLLMPLCVPMLLLVFVPGLGVTVNGATRWINLGVLNFQVVEAIKLMVVVFLAGYLVRQADCLQETFMGCFKPFAVAGMIAVLLLAQPDFGGATLILAVSGAMVWLGGARPRDLFGLAVLTSPILVWAALSESYRLKRLKSFLDPWADPYDGGFQLTQALIAVGRGEWFGVGLGGSVQKLFYLPEAHTDFILAVLAEELGLMGVVLVLTLIGILVGRGMVVAIRALDVGQYFAGYLAYGISVLLGLQALISIGVNFGVLPTKGLTLPLISSGGSSVMMTCLSIGLLLRISHEVALAEEPSTGARRRATAAQSTKDPAVDEAEALAT